MPEGLCVDRLAHLASRLRSLHVPGNPIVLPNAWHVASARMVEEIGFPVVATSSAAVAASLGTADDDSMGAETALAAVARMAAAVQVPVTADLGAGYGLRPTELVRGLLAAGAVGCNLEDSDHHGSGSLVDLDVQVERLAGVRAAAVQAGVAIVVNARVDVWLRMTGDPSDLLAEGVRRARRYLDAGADCVYPIMLHDRATIRSFVEQVGGSVNVLLRSGVPSVDDLRRLKVARVSLGPWLHRLAEPSGLRRGGTPFAQVEGGFRGVGL